MAKWSRTSIAMSEIAGLALTAEEGFVLSRLDGSTREDLVAMTGLEAERVDAILELLEDKQLAESDDPSSRSRQDTIPDGDIDAPLGSEPPPSASVPPLFLPSDPPPDDGAPIDEASYREIFETELLPFAPETRVELATTEAGRTLLALCFDPEPAVITAVVANPASSPAHARLAAAHHRDPAGLEALVLAHERHADSVLLKTLLGNEHLGEGLAKRLLLRRPLLEAFKFSIDLRVSERTRGYARAVLRSRFTTAQPEERAGLVVATEGRVLPALVGLTFDARCTQILCSRTYSSVPFVQSLAHFAACPPALLAHLSKQVVVRRHQHLRSLVLQHPNAPAEAKRKG